MPRTMVLDFSKAQPVSGTQQDRIPPGDYMLVCKKITDPEFKFKSNKPGIVCSFVVARGPETGKRLVDRFSIPTKAEDSTFGIDKFFTMATAMGINVQKRKGNFDLDSVVGKMVMASVGDNEYETTNKDGTKTKRTNSQITEYLLPTAGGQQQVTLDDDGDQDAEYEEGDDGGEEQEFFAEDDDAPAEEGDDEGEFVAEEDGEYEDDGTAEEGDEGDELFEEPEPEPEPAPRRRQAPRPVAAAATARPQAQRQQGPTASGPTRRPAQQSVAPAQQQARRLAATNNGGGSQLRRRPAQTNSSEDFPFNN